METIHLQITLIPPKEPEKPKSSWYKLGYGLAQVCKSMKGYEELKSPSVGINDLKDWSKDYSDLETPAVIRKERSGR